MMSALSHLRAALGKVDSESLRGRTFDPKLLDNETSKLRAWLGARGTAKPPQDAIATAVHAFHRNQHLSNRRQALLVCFGCIDPILLDGSRLIEDSDRFPKLLGAIDLYLPNPRAFRTCYRGLLNAYFGYDVETARSAVRRNWEELRTYLRDRVANTIAPGLLPAWVDALQENAHLLGNDPGSAYGKALLTGDSDAFEHARDALDIHENSWLIWRLVLGQVEAATREDDMTFQRYLPNLLELLPKHPLAINDGLARLLSRYRLSKTAVVNPGLRDFAIAYWGNPWLSLNRAKWSLVTDEAREMVAGWLKLILIQQFFSLLAADGINDTRRLKFWESYHDSIDDMYFALGNTARWHRGPDFQDIRKKMAGRLLNLYSAGPPNNNAFIMCIGNFVVVEFGMTGNACYIFRRDQLPFDLQGDIAGNNTALKHQRFVERLLHKDGTFENWERKFQGTLASLLRVQPQTKPIRKDMPAAVPATRAAGLNDIHQTPNSTQPQRRIRPAQSTGWSRPRDEAPVARGAALSERELSRLCDTRRLRIEDLRDRNGNLWVLTGDTDGYVSGQLRSLGFSFKAGKGWWRT
jgi:hypothetical protein